MADKEKKTKEQIKAEKAAKKAALLAKQEEERRQEEELAALRAEVSELLAYKIPPTPIEFLESNMPGLQSNPWKLLHDNQIAATTFSHLQTVIIEVEKTKVPQIPSVLLKPSTAEGDNGREVADAAPGQPEGTDASGEDATEAKKAASVEGEEKKEDQEEETEKDEEEAGPDFASRVDTILAQFKDICHFAAKQPVR